MGVYQYDSTDIPKTERISKLVEHLYKKMPEIESARAILLTESYRQTEAEPMVIRRAKAFAHILENIPIIIRDYELIVGSSTIAPRGCQTYPEFSYKWLEEEFDTVAGRSADPFYISRTTAKELKEVNRYWEGKTTSELATSYMEQETLRAMKHNLFTPGNYFYNGIGHITVKYDEVLQIGLEGIREKAQKELEAMEVSDGNYQQKSRLLQAMIISLDAVIGYAGRYAKLAKEMADKCRDRVRKQELMQIAKNCENVPAKRAGSFYEACQSFWFIQQLIQLESSGHSISPGRFDQYMYPFYKADLEKGSLTREFAQELLDCIWVKLNDLNKCRDAVSAEGFAGYSLFQNLIVGGQNKEGEDVTNDLSFMCIQSSKHVFLPQPSLSIRVWNKSPHELLLKAADLTRTGIGLPAYYNDEVIIPSMMNRGISLEEARNYDIIGCVEPQCAGKTDGWHDAAFFNMVRPLELVFSRGMEGGEQVGVKTMDVTTMKSFEQFFEAYREQMEYAIKLLVNANNSIDVAHAKRCPLPFLSCLVDDCMKRGKSVQEGGAVYNFTGPQGFGVANIADSLYTIKKLVFEEKKISMAELKEALSMNYGKGLTKEDIANLAIQVTSEMAQNGRKVSDRDISGVLSSILRISESREVKENGERILAMIEELPKYGNDNIEVDKLAREGAYVYTKTVEKFKNPRGGMFQAGLYPVSANVPLGGQAGATPDGRLAHTPVADGVSPSAGKDVLGPTAAANSVARLDHFIASNGTLYNQKFHPSALEGMQGLENFVSLIRTYFDLKGSHMQFNVVSRETLLDAQKNPDNYKHLVVRVAGYSALFTTLSKNLQDDIIRRTEQGF
ncbi:MAG: glycyl radical protein [Lachnospiraceae bacterium]|nr:glycyl radical protein [Lachnospiraceae bacterium]